MSDKIIAAKIQVDTGQASTEVKDFKNSLADTSKELKDTNKQAGESTGFFSNLKSKIGDMPGPLGAASEGVSSLSTTFKALLANPVVLVITLIVGALAALYKAFASTNDGGEKVEQMMKGMGAVLDVVRDRVLQMAGAIVKFFKGDFKGAAEDAKASLQGVGQAAEQAFNQAADATRRLQEAEDELTQSLNVSRAKLNRDMAATKELITDENASYGDRRKAIEAVRAAEQNQTNQELENAKKTLKALEDRAALSKNVGDEELNAVAEAQAKVYQIEEQSASNVRNLNRQERAMERTEQQKQTEAHQKFLEGKKQREADYANYTSQLAKLREQNALDSIKDSYVRQLREVELNYDKQKEANKQAFDQHKLTQEQLNALDVELDRQLFLKRTDLYAQHQADLQKQGDEAAKANLAKYTEEQRKLKERDEQAHKEAQDRLERNAKNRDAAMGEGSLEDRKAAYDSEVALYKDALDQKVITEQEYSDKMNDLAQKRVAIGQYETDQRKGQFEAVAQALTALSTIVGKQTVLGKALGVATALINTWQGASEALKQKSTLPSPFDVIAKVANVATVVATGLETVRNIAKVQVPGGGGGSVSTGGVSAAITPVAPVTPQQQSTSIDQASINGIGDATKNRSYVLSSDITHDQDRNERLNRAARLGG
jgi:hypothetical protein